MNYYNAFLTNGCQASINNQSYLFLTTFFYCFIFTLQAYIDAMEQPRPNEILPSSEFSAWQGLFRGFIASAKRQNVQPSLYNPYTYIDFRIGTSRMVKLSAIPGEDNAYYPSALTVEIRFSSHLLMAAAGAIWQEQLPLPQHPVYSSRILPKETTISLIRKFGGILEQPMEFHHRGLKIQR